MTRPVAVLCTLAAGLLVGLQPAANSALAKHVGDLGSAFVSLVIATIIIGVVCVWILTHVPFNAVPAGPDTLAGMLGHLLQPLLAPIGIDVKLTVALMFGFIAKEIVIGAFAVIYGMQGDTLASHMATQMDWVQAVSFMLFTLIYTPCVSTIAAIRAESKSAKFTLLSVAWPLVLAWLVSFIFYQSARALLGH